MKRIIVVVVCTLLTGCTLVDVEESEDDLLKTISYKTLDEESLSMNVYHPTIDVYDE